MYANIYIYISNTSLAEKLCNCMMHTFYCEHTWKNVVLTTLEFTFLLKHVFLITI